MGWFKTGKNAKEAMVEQEKTLEALNKRRVPKFWLDVGEEATVIFVDDEGFWCERHTLKRGDKFYEVTCSAGIRPCPFCISGESKPYGVTFFTIIDTRKYVKKDGTVAKDTKTLLPAKRTLARQIFDYKESLGSLVGAAAKLKRYGAKDPNCGIIVDLLRDETGKLKKYRLPPAFQEPFPYEEVLAPYTEQELRVLGLDVHIPKAIGDVPLFGEEEISPLELEIEKETEPPPSEEIEVEGKPESKNGRKPKKK